MVTSGAAVSPVEVLVAVMPGACVEVDEVFVNVRVRVGVADRYGAVVQVGAIYAGTVKVGGSVKVTVGSRVSVLVDVGVEVSVSVGVWVRVAVRDGSGVKVWVCGWKGVRLGGKVLVMDGTSEGVGVKR